MFRIDEKIRYSFDIEKEIKANHFHPGGGRDSVNVDGVWFVVEIAL